jgi:Mg2+ and Co2+ transporter CorA
LARPRRLNLPIEETPSSPNRGVLRDVYDHTIQVIDTVESFREILTSMVETYLSSVSNRMNEIMKV